MKTPLEELKRKRKAKRTRLRKWDVASFESDGKTKRKTFNLDSRLQTAIQKIVNILGQSEPRIIRFALIRFLHSLGVLISERGQEITDLRYRRIAVYPAKSRYAVSVPMVEPDLLNSIKEDNKHSGFSLLTLLPHETVRLVKPIEVDQNVLKELGSIKEELADIFTSKKSKTVKPARTVPLAPEVRPYTKRAARMLKVKEPLLYEVALVHFINILPDLYQQRGAIFTDYDDATIIAAKCIVKAGITPMFKKPTMKQRETELAIKQATWIDLIEESLALCEIALSQSNRQELQEKKERALEAIVHVATTSGPISDEGVKKMCTLYGLEYSVVHKRLLKHRRESKAKKL